MNGPIFPTDNPDIIIAIRPITLANNVLQDKTFSKYNPLRIAVT